ncbi:MAG: glycosyltransferase [Reichenbachiella sp.]|uniref:glycosyltransferase n=1 Tax=Reichenbachiella sp. TaxID=2184521 RepID=UPI00329A1770
MQVKKKHILVFIYNSFNDPLFQGLLFRYIKEIAENNTFHFHIITFEQEAYHIPLSEKKNIKHELANININWYPLDFHTGRLLLFKKAYDLIQAFIRILIIQIKFRPKQILAFANIAGSFSYILSKIFRWKVIVFSYEPHSQFLEELGFWSKSSLKYKLLHSIEKRLGTHGDHIITGTKHMIEQLKAWGAKSKLYRLPTSVDQNVFVFSQEARDKVRKRLNINGRKVVIYTGKFGDLYYKEEIFELCQALYTYDSTYFFVFLTGHNPAELKQLFDQVHVPESAYFIGRVPFEEVNQFLSAADIGLVTVANFPSKKYCSPTKVGEYLCCGLPYIVTVGTSEDDEYAEKYNVGVVVESFHKPDIVARIERIEQLINENKNTLRKRCRQVGIEYRGIENAIKTIVPILNE